MFNIKLLKLNENFNPLMQGDEKSSNILWKSCDVHTARFLNYVWPFFIIMHEKVNGNKECSTLSEADLGLL